MICPKCGKEFDPFQGTSQICSECLAKPEETEQRQYEEQDFLKNSGAAGFTGYCPWEDEEGVGFTRGLIETLKQSLLDPTNFFRQMPLKGGYKLPFLYALVISSISIVVGYIFSLTTNSLEMPMMMTREMITGSSLGSLVYLMLTFLLGIFLHPLVLFLCLLILGVKNATLESTFRISCYSFGPEIFQSIPFVGWLIAGVWQFVILVIGLKEGFHIGTGRAAMSILLPLITVLLVAFALIALIVGKLVAFHPFIL